MTTNDGFSAFPPPGAPGGEPRRTTLVPGHADPAVGHGSDGPRRVRRYLFIGLALGLVVIVGLVVFLVTRDDDGSDSSSAGARLTAYDPQRDEVNVFDSSGEVVDTFDGPDVDDANPVAGLSNRLVFEGDDEVAVLSIDDGSIDTFDVPEGLDLHQPLTPADTNLVFDTLNGGDVVIVDLATGESTSVVEDSGDDEDEAAFGPSRQFDEGSTYTDFRSDIPRSVVIPSAGGADYWIVEGNVLSLQDERTLSAVGESGTSHLEFWDRDESTGEATLDSFVAGGVLTGENTALIVDQEGDITEVDGESGESTVVESLDSVVRTVLDLNPDRMLVVGDDGSSSYLIDAKGTVIAEFEPETVDDEEESISVNYGGILSGASCFITQPGNQVLAEGDADGLVVLRDVETGEARTDFDTSAFLLASDDGCTATTVVDTVADISLDGEDVETFDDYTNVSAVAPDGSHVVLNGGGDFVLHDIESGDEVDLDPGFYFYVPN